MSDHGFHGHAADLRSPARLARLEPERVVGLSLQGIAASSVLDAGTGTGLFAEAFGARGLRSFGVDVNAAMLPLARSLVPGASFAQSDLECLPFRDASFDITFLGQVLHETDDPAGALRTARRVSKLRVVVLEWPQAESGPVHEGPPLSIRLSPAAIREMALSAGFSSVETTPLTRLVLYRLEL